MAAASATRKAELPNSGSSGPDDSVDGSAVLTGDSADESSNQTDSGEAVPASNRRKLYKLTTSVEHKAPEGFGTNSNKKPPIRRRIMRKDRRATLEMLTSEDDVNAYQATRPSSYLEPAACRSLHESAAHLKSSFETLYNPELKHIQVAEILSSSSSEALASEAAKTLHSDTWQLASGQKVSSPYLRADVSRRPAVNARGTPEQADRKEDYGHNRGNMFTQQLEATSGEIWTEFGGHSPTAVDGDWASNLLEAKSQPSNLSVRVSQPGLQISRGTPTHSIGSFGVDVEIQLSRSRPSTVAGVLQLSAVPRKEIEQSEKQGQNSDFSVKPTLLPDKPTMPIRGRRVLPAVPDSADLEVTDLLRPDAVAKSESINLENRPKSAVEILVAKGRCSSIQQLQASSVSQQLRSLFHNPSPHIMLYRAATQQTQPQPPRTVRAETSNSVELGKANSKYAPLRASHGSHQSQHFQQHPNGRQSAFEFLRSKKSISSNPFIPQQPPELPQRRNQGSLLPSQSFRQEAPCPTVSSHSVSSKIFSSNVSSQTKFSTCDQKFRPQTYQTQQHAISRQSNTTLDHGHDVSYERFGQQEPQQRIAVDAHLAVSTVSTAHSLATPIERNHASFSATARKPFLYSVSSHSPAQAPPLPPRRAKQGGQANPPYIGYSSQSQHVIKQANKRTTQKTEQHQVVANYQLKALQPEDIGGSGEDDSGCCQSSGEYLLAREAKAVAALSQVNPTRIQTNPRTGRAGTTLDAERCLPPRGVQLPPNAVRVLPSVESTDLDELRRVLAVRRQRTAAAVKHSGERAEDTIAGLEQMCREMRLHDDQLLDGAERRDTAIRVQTRLDAIRGSQGGPSHSAQGIGALNLSFDSIDRAYKARTDSSLRLDSNSTAATALKTNSDSRMNGTGSRQPYMLYHSTGHTLLPGEQESGPEVIL